MARQPRATIAVCRARRTGSSKKRPTPNLSGFKIDMTSFDVLLMVVDFLFLSTSVAFVFSTIKESIKGERQHTGYQIVSIVIFSFIAFLIPFTLYYLYLWFMEINFLERIHFYVEFYNFLRGGLFWRGRCSMEGNPVIPHGEWWRSGPVPWRNRRYKKCSSPMRKNCRIGRLRRRYDAKVLKG